ncbi:phage tail tape measure protein [Vibrio rumoiensis]|uniref:phage tail tape measure protein n=1 Tax=Vibrio rumoiensis TaxID=76258 RepID=UPI003AA832D4
MPSSNSNYSLELIVGIQDAFTKQAKQIEKESGKLERDIKDLQKTTADVSSFKKAEAALDELTKAEKQHVKSINDAKSSLPQLQSELKKITQQSKLMSNEESKLQIAVNKLKGEVMGLTEAGSQNTKTFKKKAAALQENEKILSQYQAKIKKSSQEEKNVRTQIAKSELEITQLTAAYKKNGTEVREHERLIQRLGHSLKNAGVDLNDLTREEKRLQDQVNKTNKSLRDQEKGIGKLQHIEKLGAIAGGVMASAGLAWAGNDKARNERLLAARSSYSLEDVQSVTQRQFRSDLIRKYGAEQESIFAAQAMAKQQNLSDQDTMDLTKATIQLQKIFPDYSSPETVRALANISKGFGISIQEAADKLYATSSTIGDTNGDLLDTFAEYSPLLGDKISFDQFAASIIQARKAGVWNTDKVGDSLKESFMARFSDSGEFAKLVGTGDKAGTVDAIQNADLRDRIKTAAYRVRDDVKSGVAPGNNYAALLALVNSASNTSDAGAIKPLLESIGGTILSEDVGTKGVKGVVDGLTNPEASFGDAQSLEEASDSISTALDKSMNAWSTGIDSLTNRSSDLIDSMDGLGDVISSLTGSATSSMNENAGVGYGALFASVLTAGFAGKFATKIGTKLGGKVLNKVLGTATSPKAVKPSSMFGGLFTKSAAEPVANIAKEANFLPKAGGALLRGGKGLLKRAPLIGTALNAGSIAMSAAEGDDAQMWKDIGATAGSWLGGLGGGALGTLAGGVGAAPGAIAGSVGGSMVGEDIASWLYDIFNGNEDPVNTQTVAQTEQAIQSAPAQQTLIAPPQVTIDLSFTPSIQIDAVSSDPEALSQSLVASLRDLTPQLRQALHDVMDDLWKDMDALDQS